MAGGGSISSRCRLKKRSSVLSGSTVSPVRISQSTHVMYCGDNVSAISDQWVPHAKRTPSSTYMPKVAFEFADLV